MLKRCMLLVVVFLLFFALVISVNASTEVTCGDEIASPGEYVLSGSCSFGNYAINITTDNVLLDCQGYEIGGYDYGFGISLDYVNNVTVQNCNVTDFYYCFKTSDSSNITFFNNSVYSCTDYGFYVSSSNYTSFYNNSVHNNGQYAYYLAASNNNEFHNNFAYDNKYGVSLNTATSDNNFTSNQIFNNSVSNLGLSSSYDNIFNSNNFCNGGNYDIYSTESSFSGENNSFNNTYFTATIYNALTNTQGCSPTEVGNITINDPCSYKINNSGTYLLEGDGVSCNKGIFVNASNVLVDCQGYSVSGRDSWADLNGIYFNNPNNVTFQNCIVSDFTYGLSVKNSSNISLINVNFGSNVKHGVYFYESENLFFQNISVYENGWSGVSLSSIDYLVMNSSSVSNNSGFGLAISSSSDVELSNNHFLDNNLVGRSDRFDFSCGDYVTDISGDYNCFETISACASNSWPSSDEEYNYCGEETTTTISATDLISAFQSGTLFSESSGSDLDGDSDFDWDDIKEYIKYYFS